jgi:hypothetical protein
MGARQSRAQLLFEPGRDRVAAPRQCSDHDPIRWVEFGEECPGRASQPSRHSMPLHRTAHRLPHDKPDPRTRIDYTLTTTRVHDEIRFHGPLAMLDRRPEFGRQSHPVPRRKHCGVFPAESGREVPAAFAAPVRHYRATGTCPHAKAEPMHPRPPAVVRLESPLAFCHGTNSSYVGHLVVSRTVKQRMRELAQLPLVSSSSRSLPGADPAGWSRRFAAVSPTFGRLFEGTDLDTAGQTAMSRAREEQTTAMSRMREEQTTAMSRMREEQTTLSQPHSWFTTVTTATRVRSTSRMLWAMFQNGWPPHRKPVSFGQCRFRLERHLLARQSQATHDPPRAPGRLDTAGPARPTERQRSVTLSCPHLWITMWTVRHRHICRPSTDQKGVYVVDRRR